MITDVAAWFAADTASRSREATALASRLGAGWSADGERLVHDGAPFAIVPGGWLRMGLCPDEVLILCRLRSRSPLDKSDWPKAIAHARPTRFVRVDPFLVSIHPTRGEPAISEAELEWVLRDAGRASFVGCRTLDRRTRRKALSSLMAPFGLEELFDDRQGCADAWHDNLVGGPDHAVPWGSGADVMRECHTLWQDDDEEVLGLHAAARERGGGVVRAVVRLEMTATGPVPDAGDTALRALVATPGREGKQLGWALELLASCPGDDLARTVAAVLAALDPADAKRTTARLRWLGDVAWGALEGDRWPREAIRGALTEGGDRLVPLLAHDSTAVRAAAVAPVAASGIDRARRAFTERAEERNPVVRGSLAIGAALLGESFVATGPVGAIAAAIRGQPDVEALIAAVTDKVVAKLSWFRGSRPPGGVPTCSACARRSVAGSSWTDARCPCSSRRTSSAATRSVSTP